MDRSILQNRPLLRRDPKTTGRHLRTFDLVVQAYGTYFGGFAWDLYGCGTYRSPKSRHVTPKLFFAFARRLSKKLKTRVAWLAVAERRTSGCGHPAIPLHWHLLMAVPPQHRDSLVTIASLIWQRHYGDALMTPYDPSRAGCFYLAKLARGTEFEFFDDNLDRIRYTGPMDMFADSQTNPNVPGHVRHLTTGQTLSLR